MTHGERVSMVQYIGSELTAMRETTSTRFSAIEKATELARLAMERRLEGMNEFRETLKNQQSTFMTRTEFCAAHDRVLDDIRTLRDYKSTMEGKASQMSLNLTLAISILGLVISMIGILISSGVLK